MLHPQIVIHRIDLEPTASEVGECRRLLNSKEVDRARQIEASLDRNRWVVFRGRLRQLLAEICELPATQIEFRYQQDSKLVLAAKHQPRNIHFSMARAERYGLIAIGTVGPFGVAFERAREIRGLTPVAAHFLHPSEYEIFRELSPSKRIEAFYSAWTRKDAVVKSGMISSRSDFDSLRVSVDPDKPAKIISINNAPPSSDDWQFVLINRIAGFVGALAICTPTEFEVQHKKCSSSLDFLA